MTINLKTRDQYLRELRGQLGQWSLELDNMEREIHEAPNENVSCAVREVIAQLRQQQRIVAKEINDIEGLSDDQDWLRLKPLADAASHNYARIYSRAMMMWPPD